MTTDIKITVRREDNIEVPWSDRGIGPGWVIDGIAEYAEGEPLFHADGENAPTEQEVKDWAARTIRRLLADTIDVRVTYWKASAAGLVPRMRARQHNLTIETATGTHTHTLATRAQVDHILGQLKEPDAVVTIQTSQAELNPGPGVIERTTCYPVRHIQRIEHAIVETLIPLR